MFRWIETIALNNGELLNLEYHQNRVQRTFFHFGRSGSIINLRLRLEELKYPSMGLYKVRVVYTLDGIVRIDCDRYVPKKWSSFELVEALDLDYTFKDEDRTPFNDLKQNLDHELIITKHGFITDTTYSNLVFEREGNWFTPNTFLLNGTQRQYLLDQEEIKETKITQCNLASFQSFKMINAMMPLSDTPAYPIESIFKSSRSFLSSSD